MSAAVAPLPSPPPLSSPSSLSFSSSSASSSPASGADIKPLVVSAGGWRPRFMRGAAPPPTLAVAPPADAPSTIRATSLPSAHNKGAGVDAGECDPIDLPDRSHSATAPPPSATSSEEVPFKRVTSLSSPSPTGSMISTSSSDNGHGTDAFAMPVGSPTFYSQDSRPSPVFHGNNNNNSNNTINHNSNPNSLPRSTATFTKSPSRPHLLRSEANGHFASSNGNNNTSPTYNSNRHIDVSSATSGNNNNSVNNWNSLSRGSNTTNETMTPSHAAITAPGLRSVQLDFQLLRQMRSDGVNGAYQIADAAGNRVIFKPNDEESFDVRTVPVSDIPSQDLAAALPAIAKQAAAAGFRGSKELVALARASSFLKVNGGNNNNERMMHHHSTSSINDENNSNSNNNSRRGGGSYIGQRSHGRGLHHRRRPRRGRGRTSQTQQQSSAASTYTPPHIDTDDESSPASPDSSRRPSTTSADDDKQQEAAYDNDMDDSSSQHDGAGESDVVLPSPPRHMSDALTSLSSSTSDTLSLVNQYMTPYLAPSQSMRMFKHDNNPCGPGVPRGVAWVSGGRGRDLMLNIKVSPRRGVAYGDTTHKEWAAYLLDHGRFSGVPRTITASVNMYHGGTLLHTGPGSASSSPHNHPHHHGAMMGPTPLKRLTSSAGEDKHGSPPFTPSLTDSPPIVPLDGDHHGTLQPLQPEPRYGSLQEFKEHICSAEDMGNSQFAVDEVHKVGILDLRLVNLDRHLGNILVAKVAGATPRDQYKLIPIDHGYILPDYRDIADVNFEWIHWKQCKEAFSAASLAYIASLDPVHDATLLKDVGVRNGSIITCVIATIMLQRAAAAGLTLFAIAEMAQRGVDDKEKSILERIVAQTDEEMAADDCHHGHHGSSNGHGSDGNGHITTDDEMDDDTIHAINRGRGTASTRGRGGSVGRGAGRGQNRSWGRAFTKTSRSAPLPTVASSPPSMDDEPLVRTSSGKKLGLSSHGGGNNRRTSGMTLEDQMDDNVHYLGQPSTTIQHRHQAHHSHQLSQDSPRASSESPASHRQAELASFAKKKNLLTSPMVNPMASPSSHVRPAPLLRHASDQVYQNGVGMTLMPDSESPALKPVANNSDDDEGMEALSLDGMTARIGSPVTSPTKSRSTHHQPHHHTTSHGFVPRSTRIAASPNWSASASPSTSPPSVSLFNRSNTGMATNSSALFTSMTASAATAGGSTNGGMLAMTRTTSTSGSATSSPGTSPPSMSPVGSPAFGSMPSSSSVPASSKFKSSARARVTISDAVSKKRLSDTASAPQSTNGSGIPLARSRPVPIRAASTRIIDSGPNSAVTSPSTPLSPMAAIAASPPSPAAIPMRMPTPMQPLPSPSPPSPGVTHLTDTTLMFGASSSPPVSPPQGTVTSTPSTPSSGSSSAPSRVSPIGRTSVTITSAAISTTTTTTSPTAVGTSAPSSSSAPSSASSSSLHASSSSSSSGNSSSVLHSTSSPPSLSSWHAIPATSVSSLTPSSTDTLALPHAAVPLKSSSSMELVRAGNGNNNLPRGGNNRPSISSSAGSASSASASSSSSDLPSVNETVPPRRYAWNEIWLRRFMKVVTGAVDHEVAKLVAAAAAAAAARSASASSSSSSAASWRSTSTSGSSSGTRSSSS